MIRWFFCWISIDFSSFKLLLIYSGKLQISGKLINQLRIQWFLLNSNWNLLFDQILIWTTSICRCRSFEIWKVLMSFSVFRLFFGSLELLCLVVKLLFEFLFFSLSFSRRFVKFVLSGILIHVFLFLPRQLERDSDGYYNIWTGKPGFTSAWTQPDCWYLRWFSKVKTII